MNVSCPIWKLSYFLCLEGSPSAVKTSHVPRMQSCYTFECVMSHPQTAVPMLGRDSRFALLRMNDSCHTYARVISHIWMRHVQHASMSTNAQQGHQVYPLPCQTGLRQVPTWCCRILLRPPPHICLCIYTKRKYLLCLCHDNDTIIIIMASIHIYHIYANTSILVSQMSWV